MPSTELQQSAASIEKVVNCGRVLIIDRVTVKLRHHGRRTKKVGVTVNAGRWHEFFRIFGVEARPEERLGEVAGDDGVATGLLERCEGGRFPVEPQPRVIMQVERTVAAETPRGEDWADVEIPRDGFRFRRRLGFRSARRDEKNGKGQAGGPDGHRAPPAYAGR